MGLDFGDVLNANSKDFRKAIEYYVDKNNKYSQDELYDVFVYVTKRYLDEVISARQLEKLFVKNYGENATNEFYEAVANSNETLSEGDMDSASQKDLKSLISAQFDLIEELNKKG
jgi:hypothetical protein